MTVMVALVGAGHAHLAVLAQASRLRAAGVEPILIAPPTFDYSGLITGVLSGALPPTARGSMSWPWRESMTSHTSNPRSSP
ncbi:MAG: hypothetical protein ACK4I0_00115 [Brevundimonas sp.]|uniref:hypothetical protein n=1 Tax=Brevundimonas sp. TaxID=1871086 RepID=UPI003918EE30